jgi:N-acetylglucosaminyl-diphospho-decaprenol L-rhamnosyltransferase
VSDVLPVVTVTYSPGPHLGRFLASLSHATERPVSVLMADNGSTDGAPQAAVERYPGVRLFSTGSNLGYGSAVNRAIAELGDVDEWIVVANPDVQWGPGSIDALLDAAARWPRAATLGPLIHDPDGSVYPSARQLPSVLRGGMHAVVGPLWKTNPWSAAYRQERLEPSERPVGWLSGSCLLVRRAAFQQIGGFDERYFMYMEDSTSMCRRPKCCITRATRPRGSRRAIWRRITKVRTPTSPTGILDHGVLRCGWPSGPVWRCGRG